MRWKFTDISQEYRCCGCIHVKRATLFIGTFMLVLQLMCFSFTMLSVSQDKTLWVDETKPQLVKTTPRLVTPQTKAEESISPLWKRTHKIDADELFGSILFYGSCIIVTSMLIYGTLKHHPGFLTPFMGLQVFDFCLSSLTLISYFSYTSDIKQWISHQPALPYKERVMAMQSDWLMLVLVLFSVGILCIKVYVMGIVWSCYKYLLQEQRSANRISRFDIEAVIPVTGSAEVVLPPKYEDVANVHVVPAYSQPPPPPYSAN